MKLLIDENLSPRLAIWANDLGIPSQAVGHVGLQGKSDQIVWEYAYRNDQIVNMGTDLFSGATSDA